LLSIPGLGPKTAKLLYDKLKVKGMDDLERLAREHKLIGLPGIKEKTEENILKGIEFVKRGTERRPIGTVLPVAEEIMRRIKEKAPVRDIAVAGSVRRWKETIRDIDILCTSTDPKKVMSVFVGLPHVRDVVAHGPTKSSVVLEDGINVDVRVVEQKSFGAALAYFTGGKAHNIRLREMAVKAGLKINEYGVFREKDERRIGGEKEEDVYRAVGLPYIPPELREDTGEIEAALEGRLPALVELKDIKGDLHVHSKWSDGSHDIGELAEEAKKRGYEYIAVTDHTKGLGIARGLDEKRLLDEIKEIDALNRKMKGIRVLKGIECDIRSDHTLDLPDGILKRLDIVVASIHSGFRQPKAKLVARLVAAMKNPLVTIIAHPTGRLIGEREAYDIDVEEVLKTARKTGTALELNAYPVRLDLNDANIKRAKESGVMISIGTDTHKLAHLDYMTYGVAVARRGWLEKGNVLNALGLKELMKAIKKPAA
jgi:DNA polymerase (family 10)